MSKKDVKNETTDAPTTHKATRDDSPRKGSNHVVYLLPDGRQVYIPKGSILGAAPESITLGGFTLAPAPVRAAKMTPEERKAAAVARKEARAKMTPQEKAAEAKAAADKAAERAAKLLALVGTTDATAQV